METIDITISGKQLRKIFLESIGENRIVTIKDIVAEMERVDVRWIDYIAKYGYRWHRKEIIALIDYINLKVDDAWIKEFKVVVENFVAKKYAEHETARIKKHGV